MFDWLWRFLGFDDVEIEENRYFVSVRGGIF